MNIKNTIEKIKNKPIIEYLLISLLFIIINIVFASKTGLLTCGYHFADDYEILEINKYINDNGLFNAISYYVVNDLGWRFRPFYILLRVIRTFVLGTNYYSWHLMVAIETGIQMALSYVLARKMKVSIIPSLIFSLIYMIGSQDEVIWRLGPQENTGILLLSLSFLLLVKYHETNKKTYGISATVVLIMMMYCKESFLLLAPSAVLFLFYLELKDDNKEIVNIFKQLWSFIKKHKIFIISLIICVILCAAIVLGYTGLYTSGYAGIDSSYSFKDYIRLTLNVFIRDLVDYWLELGLIIIFPVCLLAKNIICKNNKQLIRILLVIIIFAGYSLVSQAVIYGSSAMFTRYYLPTTWIIFFTLLVMEKDIIGNIPNSIIAIFLLLFVIYTYNNKEASVVVDAKYFAYQGKNTTEMLDYVGKLNEEKEIVVLTDNDWYEVNYSMSVYLQLKWNVKNVFYADDEIEDGNYKNIYIGNDKRISAKDADVIIADGDGIDNFNLDYYLVKEYAGYYVLSKK